MTINENQDASSMERLKTCDNDGPVPWSDLNHDVLYLVMMRLRVFDIFPFSGVCKSWRSCALSNKRKFMASRLLMCIIAISSESNEEDYYCYLKDLKDIEKKSVKCVLPHSGGRTCVGFTCGHFILFGSNTHDFWLLDPITRHRVHFPNIRFRVNHDPANTRAFLVFSHSMSGWVLVMLDRFFKIWFSISGQGTWNHVPSNFLIFDIHAFKGKMYAIENARHLCELTLNPEPKLTLLETKNFPIFVQSLRLVSLSNWLLVTGYGAPYKSYELDFEKMKWVPCKSDSKLNYRDNGKLMFYSYKENMVYPMIV